LKGPIRWIVPNAAGGGFDDFSRLFEPYLERALGVRVQVDNVPGAGGLRGAMLLSEAPPDGSTLGIVNLPGLVMSAMTGTSTLDPVEDLTLLGTLGRSRHVWSTGASGSITSADKILELGRTRGLVFGMNSFSSLGFLSAAIPCGLLGLKAEFVSGLSGSSDTMMSLIRGEVDLVSISWDSQLGQVLAGDLRPVLRIAGSDPPEHDAYTNLPTLAGKDGLAAALNPEAVQDAEALVRFTGTGRAAAAPRGLPPGLERCLSASLCEALMEPSLARAAAQANLAWNPACAEETREEARVVKADIRRLTPIVREAVARVRA
jgi:tripartite-type tricarboxylate transporter receptor subunit TctC